MVYTITTFVFITKQNTQVYNAAASSNCQMSETWYLQTISPLGGGVGGGRSLLDTSQYR